MNTIAILTADWHLRGTVPKCRTDNYLEAQERKAGKIREAATRNDCPILVAGDLGDKPEWPNWLLEWFIRFFAGVEIYVVPGQHDLPEHRLDKWKQAGLGVLSSAGAITVFDDPMNSYLFLGNDQWQVNALPYGSEQIFMPLRRRASNRKYMLLAHSLVSRVGTPWSESVKDFVNRFPWYDMYVVGDNHIHDIIHLGERKKFVSPGSLMRMTADQFNHFPKVIHMREDGSLSMSSHQTEQGVVSRQHIEEEEKRKAIDDIFIEQLAEMRGMTFTFEGRVEMLVEDKGAGVQRKVWGAVK